MIVFLITILLFGEVLFAEQITLEKSIEYAIDHNQSVLIAKKKITASEGTVTSARALLLPQITASAGYTRLSNLSNLSTGDVIKLPVYDAFGKPTGSYIPYSSFSFSADRLGDIYTGQINLQYVLYAFGKLNEEFVYVVKNNTIQKRNVKPGYDDGKFLEIVEGIKEGESIAAK